MPTRLLQAIVGWGIYPTGGSHATEGGEVEEAKDNEEDFAGENVCQSAYQRACTGSGLAAPLQFPGRTRRQQLCSPFRRGRAPTLPPSSLLTDKKNFSCCFVFARGGVCNRWLDGPSRAIIALAMAGPAQRSV